MDGIQLVGSNSSVLHSSALGIALFSIFINDLEAGVECILSKLIDDTEMGGTVDPLLGQEALQDDLDRLGMKFNKGRCWVLCLGWRNTRHRHRLGGECEHVQRRAVKLVEGLESVTYAKSLRILGSFGWEKNLWFL